MCYDRSLSYFVCVLIFITGISGQSLSVTPATVTVTEGGSATLICSYTNDGSCAANLAWKSNGNEALYILWTGTECTKFRGSDSLAYSCTPNQGSSCVYSLTLEQITNSQHGDVWTCVATSTAESEKATIYVNVPITGVQLTIPKTTQVKVTENHTSPFVCETTAGRPVATIMWYKQLGTENAANIQGGSITTIPSGNLVKTRSTLLYTPSRNDNGYQVYCTAMSTGSSIITSHKASLFVHYAPRSPVILGYTNGQQFLILDGKQQTLTCSADGGRPLASLIWTCFSSFVQDRSTATTAAKEVKWTATRSHDGHYCTCRSSHITGDREVYVVVKVLYAPVAVDLQDTDVIVRTPLTVQCTAIPGNPPQTSYSWTRTADNWGQIGQAMNITSVQKTDADVYTCTAWNVMIPTAGDAVNGEDTATFNVNVLYAPVINILPERSIVLSSRLAVKCTTTPGNPPQTSYKWTRSTDNWVQTEQTMSISSVQKTDTGDYTCTASNTMALTGGSQVNGKDIKTFALDVLYKASITSFILSEKSGSSIYIVDENSTTTFQCQVDSNPASEITIRKNGGSQLVHQSNTHFATLTTTLGCHDAGKYECTGYNNYNGKDKPVEEVELLVRCAPRLLENVSSNITIQKKLHDKVTLTLTATAYPAPEFKWFAENRCNGSGWIQLTTGISSDVSTSNMTIERLQQADFGRYKLIVSNGIVPDFIQLFIISVLEEQSEQLIQTCSDLNVSAVAGAASAAGLIVGAALIVATLFLLQYLEIDTSGETSGWHGEEELHQYEGLTDANFPTRAYESLSMESVASPANTPDGSQDKTYVNLDI